MDTPSKIDRGTLGGSRVSRSLTVSFGLLRKHLWLWPLLAALMLAVAGLWIRQQVERAAKAELAKSLQTVLQADVAALAIWMENHVSHVRTLADGEALRRAAGQLAQLGQSMTPDDPSRLVQSDLHDELRQQLRPSLATRKYVGFVLISKDGLILSSDHRELIGAAAPQRYAALVQRAIAGGTTVSQPFPSTVLLRDENRELRAGVPTMFVVAPVRNVTGEVIGGLAMRIRPETEFTAILQVARIGESGETYAFSREGLMLSESRFTKELVRIGLLPDQPNAKAILNVQLRDPGVDMTRGRRPAKSRAEQPPTLAAASAAAGRSGVNVDGYNDYRGVPVIGAWTWLPEYDLGVATEIDVAEAYRPIYILRRAFWSLFALLAVCAGLILAFSIAMARLHRSAQKAALAAKELGQYQLEEKLGEGGMGVVYRGRHKMLRRPTAIKLLHPDKVTDDAIARFEREVQLTCQLNHPNTVAIYDFGRTSEGIFFYAMEYLEGMNLETLVARHGRQSEARAIHILAQICGSLAEAHELGLVHRDIKPANLMLGRRGGLGDQVKVLDFGLVKAVDSRETAITAANVVMGTPNYMAPESFERPDSVGPASDLYAVAAVGYFLLTGTPPFSGSTPIEVCLHHVKTPPERPADRIGQPLADDLQAVLLRGLAKQPSGRFASALEFAEALAACAAAGDWTARQAAAWWRTAESGVAATQSLTVSPSTGIKHIHQLPTMELAK